MPSGDRLPWIGLDWMQDMNMMHVRMKTNELGVRLVTMTERVDMRRSLK
jgi:hypothetical protein